MRTVRVIDKTPRRGAPYENVALPQAVPGLEHATLLLASASTESDELSVAILVVQSLPSAPSSAIAASAREILNDCCCAFAVLSQDGRVEVALADQPEAGLVPLVAAVAAVTQVSYGWDESAIIEAALGGDVYRLKPTFMGAHTWAVTPAAAA